MPYKFETDKIHLPKSKDRRRKLTEADKQEIRNLSDYLSQRELAKQFNVSRRTIQFILDPEKLKQNKLRRKERGGTAIYYDADKHREYTKTHRRYKAGVINCATTTTTTTMKVRSLI